MRHLGPPAPQPPHAPGPHAFGDRDYLRGILDGGRFCRDRDRGAAVSRPRRYARGGGRACDSVQLAAAADRRKTSRRGGAAGDRARHRGGFRPLCGERGRAPAGDFLLVTARRPVRQLLDHCERSVASRIVLDRPGHLKAEFSVELRCLEIVRSQDDLTTGARQGVLLDRPHQARAVTLVAQLGRNEKIAEDGRYRPSSSHRHRR